MTPLRIAVLPGDGIGPEITAATLAILGRLNEALGLGLRFEEHAIGLASLERAGSTFPRDVQEACRAMFGDILSEEAAELSGSIGLAASINAGDGHCMAQAQHGSAPELGGRDLANPASLVLSAGMLLGWLARRHGRERLAAAERAIEAGVDALVRDAATRTRDLGGTLGTRAWTEALLARIGKRA